MKKRLFTWFICLIILLAVSPMQVFAAETVASGTCGDNLTWTLDDAGTLTISGTGDMSDFLEGTSPWHMKRTSVKTVVIEDGVTGIGSYAFYSCIKLTEITIPESITSIGDAAFNSCTKLSTITIPEGVTRIGDSAFHNCSSLSEITIPEGVTSIGSRAFSGCSSLTEITIPESVTTIDYWAFSGCSSLTEITIPEGVTTIGYFAFMDCSSLTEITIPEGVASIGWSVFSGCSSLSKITIPEGVTSIGSSTFFGCSSLTEITIPEGVTSIGSSAFSGCSSLTEITIPEGVTSFGNYAFEDCSSLTEITIPEGVTSIGYSAFSGCSSLTEITIPEGVTSFGDFAFDDCSSLTEITIPGSVTTIGGYAFRNCSSLTEIIIPEGVTSIDDGAFSGCSSLTEIIIPEGVTSIGSYAFYGCIKLTEITIPEGVTSIGNYAFNRCTKLSKITIPEGVTSIGNYAFNYCSSLTEITIPEGVISIGDYAFEGCSSLTDVYYGGTETQWDELSNTPDITRIHYNCPAADGHWTEVETPPTCVDSGISFETCSCGYKRNEESIPATGEHYYESVVTPPTCEENGYTTYTCANCGDTYIGDKTSAEGHIWSEATCSDPIICSVCHAIEEGTALGHSFGPWVEIKAPSASEEGLEKHTCTRCGHAEERAIEKLNNPFEDVSETNFYYAPVLWALENNITKGVDDTHFGPDQFCNRGQVVTFLWRAAGKPEPASTNNPFVDVKEGDFFYKPVLWAIENNITKGVDDTHFGPDQTCNRGQVVTFLWRAAGKPEPTSSKNSFVDMNASDFFYKPVLWALENNVTKGVDATHFGPDQSCNRGQVVTFLYRTKN